MANQQLVNESQKLEQQPWFYLLEFHLDDVNILYLADAEEDVMFDGILYTGYPFSVGEINTNAQGEIPETEVSLASPNRVFQDYVEQFNGLEGNVCIIRIVNKSELADATAKIEFVFRVAVVQSTVNGIKLTLTTRLDELFVKVPVRRILKLRCLNVYRGEGCWLRQTQDPNTYLAPPLFTVLTAGDPSGNSCTKILNDASNGCEAHANKERFGAFVGVSDTRVPLNIT